MSNSSWIPGTGVPNTLSMGICLHGRVTTTAIIRLKSWSQQISVDISSSHFFSSTLSLPRSLSFQFLFPVQSHSGRRELYVKKLLLSPQWNRYSLDRMALLRPSLSMFSYVGTSIMWLLRILACSALNGTALMLEKVFYCFNSFPCLFMSTLFLSPKQQLHNHAHLDSPFHAFLPSQEHAVSVSVRNKCTVARDQWRTHIFFVQPPCTIVFTVVFNLI